MHFSKIINKKFENFLIVYLIWFLICSFFGIQFHLEISTLTLNYLILFILFKQNLFSKYK